MNETSVLFVYDHNTDEGFDFVRIPDGTGLVLRPRRIACSAAIAASTKAPS